MSEFINDAKDKLNQLFELERGWDDEDALILTEEVYTSSLNFLNKLYLEIPNLIIPEINLCKDGTIDFSFRAENFRLLINISDINIRWYGDNNYDENKTKQTYHSINDLIKWINNIINDN